MRHLSSWEQSFAPRWSLRAVLFAVGVTLGMYLLLPYLERLSAPPEKTTSLRTVNAVELPPPPPPPPRPEAEPKQKKKQQVPQPRLQKMQRRLNPLKAQLQLDLALGNVGGDFSVDFGVRRAPVMAEEPEKMVFELSELDEPPRPLTRLKPLYPAQARMRRLQGVVVVEFTVGRDGVPREIEVVSEQPAGTFTEAAIRAIDRWRFSPGTKGGQPVDARVRQKVMFQLNQE